MEYDAKTLGPTKSFVIGQLYAVADIGPHTILSSRPRERWDFEAELFSRGQLVPIYFPKWNHPHSARSKFLRTWLGDAFRAEMLVEPKLLIGRTGQLEIRTSIDSDGIMNHWIAAVRPE